MSIWVISNNQTPEIRYIQDNDNFRKIFEGSVRLTYERVKDATFAFSYSHKWAHAKIILPAIEPGENELEDSFAASLRPIMDRVDHL